MLRLIHLLQLLTLWLTIVHSEELIWNLEKGITVYEDEIFDETKPLLHAKWNEAAQKCSSVDLVILTPPGLDKTIFPIIYTPKSTEAKIILKDSFRKLLPEVYTLAISISLTCEAGVTNNANSLPIIIKHVNLYPPEITRTGVQKLNHPENTPIAKALATLSVTDKDMSRGDEMTTLTIELADTDSSVKQHFKLERTLIKTVYTVEIFLIKNLDYETQSAYNLEIKVTDKSENRKEALPQNEASSSFFLDVTDIHDQPPKLMQICRITTVLEEAEVGQLVATIKAIDGDTGVRPQGIMKYELGGDEITKKYLQVDENSGLVTIKTSPDLRNDDLKAVTMLTYDIKVIELKGDTNVQEVEPSTSTLSCTINLQDIDNSKPKFKINSYTAEVPEHSFKETVVRTSDDTQLVVTDDDQGINARFDIILECEACNSNTKDMFHITPIIGVKEATFSVKVKDDTYLEYDDETILGKDRKVILTLRAKGTEDPNMKDEAKFTITVTDINDNPPEITSVTTAQIKENSPPTVTVLTKVTATDKDSGDFGVAGLRYFIPGSSSLTDSFQINSETGVITLKERNSVDREVLEYLTLPIEVVDNRGTGNRVSGQISITVLDDNDNNPIFKVLNLNTIYNENDLDFQGSVKFEATDADKPNTDFSRVEYSLEVPSEFFKVQKDTGELELIKKLDFEENNPNYPPSKTHDKSNIASRLFEFKVKAEDCGNPKLASKTNAVVTVQFMDMNDNVPIFKQSVYTTTIEEILKPKDPIQVTVVATDADVSPAYNKVYYSLAGNDIGNFLVDRTTGKMIVAPGATLAPELNNGQSVFKLTVEASDGLSNDEEPGSKCEVQVTVTDVNNQKPTFNDEKQIPINQEFKEEDINPIELAKFIAEDVDSGHQIEYRIDFDESRAETPQYAVVNEAVYNWKKVFNIDPNTGLLTATKADRENMKKVTLVIEAKDIKADPRYSDQVVKILRDFVVLDINDHPPDFINHHKITQGPVGEKPNYRTDVLEHEERANLFKIEATDKDENQEITFSLEVYPQNPIDYFTIDQKTGVISMKPVDYDEGFEWMNVTVKATDNGDPPLSSLAYVTVAIIDKNDKPPVFEEKGVNYTITMPENEPIETLIIKLKATDLDKKDEYGLVHYRIQPDDTESKSIFKVGAETGELRNRVILDYDSPIKRYTINVEAFDNPRNLDNSLSTRKAVYLHLTDVNDNPPEFEDITGCIECPENYEIERFVYAMKATDKDSGINAEIEYFIENVDSHFSIDKDKGEIKVKKDLTNIPIKGNDPKFHLTFVAKDKGVPPLNHTKVFCIEVTDVNNNKPEFKVPKPENRNMFRKEGEATLNKVLVKVEAEDIDLGPENGAVEYNMRVTDNKTTDVVNAPSFVIDQVTGVIKFAADLSKKDLAKYNIRVRAIDKGIPPLEADPIDLYVEIISDDDYLPHFNPEDGKNMLMFTENALPKEEKQFVPEAKYRDVKSDTTEEKPNPDICYYLVGGDKSLFELNERTKELNVLTPLDRETHAYHHIIIQAEACNLNKEMIEPRLIEKPNVLNVTIKVIDVNDNPPVFVMDPFTAGVSTNTKEGRNILTVLAIDADEGENAVVTYSIYGSVVADGAENVENIQNPFKIGGLKGDVNVTFNIAKNMKGHFSFAVLAEDKDKLNDTSKVLIYFKREDQQVVLVVDKSHTDLKKESPEVLQLVSTLNRITKNFCNVDEIRQYEGNDIRFKNHTNIYVHFVNNVTQKVMEADEALELVRRHYREIKQEIEGSLYLVDAQRAFQSEESSATLTEEQIKYILIGTSAGLLLAFMVSMTLFCLKITSLKRNLKAATATAFGSQDSGLNRVGVKSAPNTNQHTVEGSNPVWNQKEEIIYNEERSLYGSDTASMKSIEDEVIEYPNESKVNPAFLDDEGVPEPLPMSQFISGENETHNDSLRNNEKLNKYLKKNPKNTINTLRQIDNDWRRRHTHGELEVEQMKKNNDLLSVFDIPDPRRRQSTFISPIPTSEL